MNEKSAGRPLALQIQRLGGFKEQTLVLLHAAELRQQDRSASPGEIAGLFRALRLPPPKNERQHLSQLRAKGLAMQPRPGVWATTPEGREEIGRLMGQVGAGEFVRLGHEAGEPVFAGAAHHLIPAEFAPAQFHIAISRFFDRYPFDRNVFCVTRYPEDGADEALRCAITTARDICTEHGLLMHLASDRATGDLLFENVGGYIWASRYGIAILEARSDEGLNYNVVLEAGAMLVTGRRCLLLKDVSIERLPTDLIGHLYKEVDIDDLASVGVAVREWIEADLGVA